MLEITLTRYVRRNGKRVSYTSAITGFSWKNLSDDKVKKIQIVIHSNVSGAFIGRLIKTNWRLYCRNAEKRFSNFKQGDHEERDNLKKFLGAVAVAQIVFRWKNAT